MSSVYYNVTPRYTPGSPAMVSREQAERTAAQEREFYNAYLECIYGKEEQEKARTKGLSGIVEVRHVHGSLIEITDMITGATRRVADKPERGARDGNGTRTPAADMLAAIGPRPEDFIDIRTRWGNAVITRTADVPSKFDVTVFNDRGDVEQNVTEHDSMTLAVQAAFAGLAAVRNNHS